MKIDLAWLKEHQACSEGCEWFRNQKETDSIKVLNALIKDDKLDWANWLICRVFNRKQKIQYAIFAAEQVIDIFEKQYPGEKRPRLAIEAAKAVLKNDTQATGAAALAAGDDAWAAAEAAAGDARTAAAAARTAWAAWVAWDAVGDDAWAAWDARTAAWDAVAAGAAAGVMQLKILNYGIGLLK